MSGLVHSLITSGRGEVQHSDSDNLSIELLSADSCLLRPEASLTNTVVADSEFARF